MLNLICRIASLEPLGTVRIFPVVKDSNFELCFAGKVFAQNPGDEQNFPCVEGGYYEELVYEDDYIEIYDQCTTSGDCETGAVYNEECTTVTVIKNVGDD